MALKIEIKSKRDKSYELKVIVKLREFENTNIHLGSLPAMFMSSILEIPRASTGFAYQFYKAFTSDDNKKVEVWHLDSLGEKKRLIAIVTDDGKQNNPFNF